MKTAVWSRVWAALLAAALTLGVLGCFLSVYELPLERGEAALSILCAVCAGILVLPLRRGGEIALCCTTLALGYLLRLPRTVGEIKSFLYLISLALDAQYHWGYFDFPGALPGNVGITVDIYGCLLGLAVCRSVLRRRTAVLPLLLAAPMVALCALIPGKNPAVWAVFLLLAGSAMLLLTSGARKNSAIQGLRLSNAACLPVLACVGLLLLLNPQEGYVDRSAPLRENLLSGFRSAAMEMEAFVPEVNHTADLAALSGGQQPRRPVLTVTAPQSGMLYLRGQDFDTYTGLGWTADPDRKEYFDGWGEERGTFTVKTFGMQDVLYLPYYPGNGNLLTGGARVNTDGLTHYYFTDFSQGSAVSPESLDIYLELPESTRAWAEEMLPSDAGPEEIGALVRNHAVYNLRTPQMPEEETDFARWFLEQSDRGYCVHFATAATVLLRAAGIPARYVTGFCQEAEAGKSVVVTTQEAHAWTEYYDIGRGCWKILDATPAAGETPTETVTTMPAETTPRQPKPEKQEKTSSLLPWLVLPGAVLAVLLRRFLVVTVRRERKHRSGAKKRALLLWQEAERLAQALGESVPQELLELAEKAKFSQHRITPMDLVPLESYCQECREKLEKKPWWKRLAEKYVFLRM